MFLFTYYLHNIYYLCKKTSLFADQELMLGLGGTTIREIRQRKVDILWLFFYSFNAAGRVGKPWTGEHNFMKMKDSFYSRILLHVTLYLEINKLDYI